MQRPNLDLIMTLNICISGQLCDSFTSRGEMHWCGCACLVIPERTMSSQINAAALIPTSVLSFSHDGILISQESKPGSSLSMLPVTSCPPLFFPPSPLDPSASHRPTSHHGMPQRGTKRGESGWMDLRSAPPLRRGNCVLMSFCRKHRMAPKHRGELLSFKLSF